MKEFRKRLISNICGIAKLFLGYRKLSILHKINAGTLALRFIRSGYGRLVSGYDDEGKDISAAKLLDKKDNHYKYIFFLSLVKVISTPQRNLSLQILMWNLTLQTLSQG